MGTPQKGTLISEKPQINFRIQVGSGVGGPAGPGEEQERAKEVLNWFRGVGFGFRV